MSRSLSRLLSLLSLTAVASAALVAAPSSASASVNCNAFAISGVPIPPGNATWTYNSTDNGTVYSLKGVLLTPIGAGPFPAAVVSHGKGGSATGYSLNMGRELRDWGMVVIATNYSHGSNSVGDLPLGDFGASPQNILRAHKAYELLSCISTVDLDRVAAHGHSMGAFVTAGLLGAYPGDFAVASHTAGGVDDGTQAAAPSAAEVQGIVTPYQLHHGDADTVVPLALDQALNAILTTLGVPHQLRIYAGFTHGDIGLNTTMLSRVRTWYRSHGVLP